MWKILLSKIFNRKKSNNLPNPEIIIIISAAGCSNFGDDIIAKFWITFYSSWPVILIAAGKPDFLKNQTNVAMLYNMLADPHLLDHCFGFLRWKFVEYLG